MVISILNVHTVEPVGYAGRRVLLISISNERVREILQDEPTQSTVKDLGYLCPKCGRKAVKVDSRAYVGQIQCMACGWHMSVAAWNALTLAEKKAMYKKGGIVGKIKSKIKRK